ncbi:alanine racemase [Neolewinella antarctica]|uniref:Alanine racemase n=1 Tax=Neolewinella antarctica TaxID=442734 RepID=A0ABX0X970_9BACT|nr:alanine racemase [Neolewinella antarctica]NJC25368.1 alanine racemase [Neolewinella antarctica]
MDLHYDPYNISELYATYRGFDLIIDSRRVTDPGRSLFFALPGSKLHGVDFLTELLGRGVRHFVVPREEADFALSRVQDWRVEARMMDRGRADDHVLLLWADTPVVVLQDLAAHHRRQFDIPVIGITGSNGKTIVKDWLVQLLETQHVVCASPRSFNSQIGVPLSVWQLTEAHTLGIFEAGISRLGEMENLERIIQPTVGVFTSFGAAHGENFWSDESKLREKVLLFRAADTVIVPQKHAGEVATVSGPWGRMLTHHGAGRTQLVTTYRTYVIDLPDLPPVYLQNAYTALATAAWVSGLGEFELLAGSRKLLPLENRLQQTEGLHGGPIINDSYSNDIDALAAAIDFASQQSPTGKIQLILGTVQRAAPSPHDAILSRDDRALLHLLDDRIDTLTLVEETVTPNLVAGKIEHFPSPAALLSALPSMIFSSLPILVKGASYQKLDRVARALSRQQHRTVLRVDLGALQHNFRVYKARAGLEMIVMVKASAYGGGALPIARALAAAGADYLAVAYVDEGKELRRGGVALPIMVLNPEPKEFTDLAEFNLEPVVGTPAGLRLAHDCGLPVHLELDTGMARLGFAHATVLEGLKKAGPLPRVASVFSHLAASGAPEHDDFTRVQGAHFRRACAEIAGLLGYQPRCHLLNSNGISRWPDLKFDAVRLGIGLYGIGDEALAPELRPVLRLSTYVAQINDLPAGSSVGYDRKGTLTRDSRIATISIGYADGLPRLVGEGRFSVVINGKRAPIIGAVCMDMTMVDVTELPESSVGDEAVIFGPDAPIVRLAEAARTIPYEILTGIGPRVHRIYVRE